MKKNKEWAFIELGKLFPSHAEMYDYPDNITVMKCELLNKVYDILSQLDEAEVLSQEWINEHITDGHNVNLGDKVVYADELDGVLVPKQELPVIPKFVADWIVECKEIGFTIQQIFYQVHSEYKQNIMSPTSEWINENEGLFAESYLYGYEVEEEQKYRVEDNHGRTLLAKMTYSHKGKTFEKVEPHNELLVGYKKELTEQEIKDYDPRYFAFAKKVEELEE